MAANRKSELRARTGVRANERSATMKSMATNPMIRFQPTQAAAAGVDPEIAWQQILARDADAKFFYAVTTTGVFCRPDCPSRRPLRENVRFFSTPVEAQAAGYRACQRCKPTAATARGDLLEQVRRHLETNLDRPVRLGELGRVVGMSSFTVQRLFKQAMGREPAAIPARPEGTAVPRRAQAGRYRDQCYL